MMFSHKNVVTRKSHRCHGCCKRIPIGSKVEYFCGIVEGDFSWGYTCDICKEVISGWSSDMFPYYEGDVIEDPEWKVVASKRKKEVLCL